MIRPLGEVALQSFKDLKKYQLGKNKPIKTGREWLDDIFERSILDTNVCLK
jgi:hypothetical protein